MQQGAVAHVEAAGQQQLDEGRFGLQPADAESGGDHLRERARQQHAATAGDGRERGRALGREEEFVVGRVLEDVDALAGGQVDEVDAALERHRDAGGVVVGGDRVDQLGRAAVGPQAGDLGLELVEPHAIVVQVHAHDLDAVPAEGAQRAGERGHLGDHDVAGVEQERGGHVDRAGGAVGEDEVVGAGDLGVVAGEVLADLGPQGLVAHGAAVDQGAVVGDGEGALHGAQEALLGLRGGVGDAAGHGDRRPLRLDAAARQAPVGRAAGGEAAQARALEVGGVAVAPARAAAGGDGVQFGFQVGRLGGHRASPGSVRSAGAGASAGTGRRAVSRLCACD